MIKVIIIDDEPLARMVIRDYLSVSRDISVVAECVNGFDAFKAIGLHAPDLIFLDIQMPKISGFELLELLDTPPGIIFTTAFDEYAIKAFEANAIDYLLKPFSKERFEKALSKWKELKSRPGTSQLQSDLADSLPHRPEQNNRIVVKSGHNIRVIPIEEILYVEAYDDYVKIHIKNDCFLKMQTMQRTETQLGNKQFLRVHRSYILNLGEITRIESMGKETYVAVMRDEAKIPLSKQGYGKLKTQLGI